MGIMVLLHSTVAPLVGAWIEIKSLPSWERGLKLYGDNGFVAQYCRSPRGSVD